MKKYRVISGFCIRSGVDAHPGEVVEFESASHAATEVRNGRVVEYVEEASATADASPLTPPDGEPVTEKRRRR